MAKKPPSTKTKSSKKPAPGRKTDKPSGNFTAEEFIRRLKTYRSNIELKKYERFFKFSEKEPLKNDEFIGVRMGQVFQLAKEFIEMPPSEIEKLMDSRIHEARAGAMSIMDKQAREKKTPTARRKELFDLYLRRHDRVNSWDLVDLAAIYVIGGYLADKPRSVLYKLARSKDPWQHRTAIVSTGFFIRQGDLDDTYQIAGMLLNDPNELVQKATGWMLRFAGDKDQNRLLKFLDQNVDKMPRIVLRASIEKLNKKQRDHYLKL